MSRQAIAAVIARSDLASGERLVALALASFADRENRAWPGAPAAAARAGLRRSRYQEAREELVRRGLVAVDERATGRGRASTITITLTFAEAGPWWDGEINVELFEAVLGYSSASGPARLLLATMAAIADEDGRVQDVSSEQLCAAAGMTDRTYRRARRVLLASDEIVLETSAVGGRGNRNVWRVPDPRLHAGRRRCARRGGSRRRRARGRSSPRRGELRRRVGAPRGPTLQRQRAVRTGRFPPRSVRSVPGFPMQRAVRTGRFRRRTVRSVLGFPLQRAVRTGHFSTNYLSLTLRPST